MVIFGFFWNNWMKLIWGSGKKITKNSFWFHVFGHQYIQWKRHWFLCDLIYFFLFPITSLSWLNLSWQMKGEEKKQFYGQGLDNLMVTTLPRVMQLNQRHCNKEYHISSYSFRGNYSFLNLKIQRSQYIRPKITVHKCAETNQGRN